MKSWTNEQLIEAIKNSNKFSEVYIKLGLKNYGSNSKTIKKYIRKLDIDISHFLTRKEILFEARQQKHANVMTNEELFCINLIDRKYIKKIILRDNLIAYECKICSITEWCGKKLSLHLDHINGINNDNRLDNLRFLCPNCHSLTETYCAKNKKTKKKETKNIVIKEEKQCLDCNISIRSSATYCGECIKTHRTVIVWPDDTTLLLMVKKTSYSKVGRQLNVSDNAVRKRLKKKKLIT